MSGQTGVPATDKATVNVEIEEKEPSETRNRIRSVNKADGGDLSVEDVKLRTSKRYQYLVC